MQKFLVQKIVAIIICTVAFAPNFSLAHNNSFEVSKKTITLGESVQLTWDVHEATTCYLYGPTSKEPNVPDTYGNKESVTVTPSKEKSDWQKGKKATYTLSCLDETELNADGNFAQVLSKKVAIKLIKPKKEKIPQGLSQRVTSTMSEWGVIASINPPKTWEKTDLQFDFSKNFTSLSRSASISLEQLASTTWEDTKENFVSDSLSSIDATKIRSGAAKIDNNPAVFVEYKFDGAYYKIFAFPVDSDVYTVTATAPLSQWSKYKTTIERSIKTLHVRN